MNSDTAAIVVTYNRKELLAECIEHLQKQTYKADIIVIDNMSTDGTPEMLKPLVDEDKIIYHSTGANLGGAGGFFEGIKLAYKLGYEYFWLMDDDSMPTPDALEQLKEAGDKLQGNFGFLSSRVVWTDGSICLMNVPKESLYKKVDNFDDPVVKIKMGTFVSFFTKREVVEEVGLPIKEFFIWGDDVEYSQRISRSYPCYLINTSRVVHKTKNNYGSNIATDDFSRIKRYELAYRNEVFLYREAGAKGFFYQTARLCLHVFRVIAKAKDHKSERLHTISAGTKAGFKFHPEIKRVQNEM
ncbi:MAG: glycosyltransferase [Lachnospiraceae bacterium]|uniref:Glycosyltransferase n=1 Tax=Candidatus Weimeria bifida TaxID=2599074 RepID=A0A6N7J0V6_9FIRM|nr:glycosyltransferase [Candidatus Weimeria bifida]RRF95911.1 MAG: glycosyltransferase [Lachnospiraceae bacterium]